MDLLLSFSDFVQFKEMMLFERAHFVATTPKPKSSKAQALGLANSVKEMKNPEIKLENNKANENELKYFENNIDGLLVSGTSKKVNKNDDDEGEEIPDLNLDIKKMNI